ncbi:MAG: hypothetical protein SFU21_00170 [Flavihumibacter sp.]|nr:hypothetical protein [Flavihumibacter sp.]
MENKNHRKSDQMRHHIDLCSKSGLTVAEYCLQNGIVKSGYYYWSKKLQGENKAPGFTAISIAKRASVEITYPNGVELCFTGEINVATIKALVCCI